MSHAIVLVIVPSRIKNVKAKVERLMAPYDENGGSENKNSKWDWWVIGGRWTGALSDYDPRQDPRNMEDCTVCGATGKRVPPPNVGPGTIFCNVCEGKGTSIKWNYEAYDGDVQPVSVAIERNIVPFAFLTPDGVWHERATLGWFASEHDEKMSKDQWKLESQKLLKLYEKNHLAVVVDYHV